MSRAWIVRSVALLLVLVGLQAGAFRDLQTGHEVYLGTEDNSAAVLYESRKADPDFAGLAAADTLPRVPVLAGAAHMSCTAPGYAGASSPRWLLPDPIGPPRA